jgi:hypothetical protein
MATVAAHQNQAAVVVVGRAENQRHSRTAGHDVARLHAVVAQIGARAIGRLLRYASPQSGYHRQRRLPLPRQVSGHKQRLLRFRAAIVSEEDRVGRERAAGHSQHQAGATAQQLAKPRAESVPWPDAACRAETSHDQVGPAGAIANGQN